MPVIREDVDPELFRLVKDRNLEHQYYLLETMVLIALRLPGFKPTPEIVFELNRAVVRFLTDKAGQHREDDVYIEGALHQPPSFWRVDEAMNDFFRYLRHHWEQATAAHLAAYALWRLNWIHPFEEGNGRTARAVSYFVLCLKHRTWLPGRNTIMQQMRAEPQPYYDALRAADRPYADSGTIDVSVMEGYIEQLFIRQLSGR